MSLHFKWDERKALSNRKKHRVSFEESATVFGDPLSLTVHDERHSTEEDRYVILGESDRGRLLVVSFTERDQTIGIISARTAEPRERRNYEEKK